MSGIERYEIDSIIHDDINNRKRRIIKRFIKQKLRLEKSNYKPSVKLLKQMLIWNKKFEYNKKELMI